MRALHDTLAARLSPLPDPPLHLLIRKLVDDSPISRPVAKKLRQGDVGGACRRRVDRAIRACFDGRGPRPPQNWYRKPICTWNGDPALLPVRSNPYVLDVGTWSRSCAKFWFVGPLKPQSAPTGDEQ